MPESRDRLERPVDHAEVYLRQRAQGILDEQEMSSSSFWTPIARTATTTTAERRATILGQTGGGGHLRRSFGSPIAGGIGRSRNLYRSPVLNRENTPAGSSRRSGSRWRDSVLPHWYPRTPLRDVTAVVRAIERSRARLRAIEGEGNDSPAPPDRVLDSSVVASGDYKRNTSLVSTTPTVGKVPKLLLGFANQNVGESESLTPQKKLLNSIDKVEKVVMAELHKLKRTPSAKKAERERRVRTLMSMR